MPPCIDTRSLHYAGRQVDSPSVPQLYSPVVAPWTGFQGAVFFNPEFAREA